LRFVEGGRFLGALLLSMLALMLFRDLSFHNELFALTSNFIGN